MLSFTRAATLRKKKDTTRKKERRKSFPGRKRRRDAVASTRGVTPFSPKQNLGHRVDLSRDRSFRLSAFALRCSDGYLRRRRVTTLFQARRGNGLATSFIVPPAGVSPSSSGYLSPSLVPIWSKRPPRLRQATAKRRSLCLLSSCEYLLPC